MTDDFKRRIDDERDRFEAAVKSGSTPRIEDFVVRVGEPHRKELLRELLHIELHYAKNQVATLDDYASRFKDDSEVVEEVFQLLRGADAAETRRHSHTPSEGLKIRCPNCRALVSVDDSVATLCCPDCGTSFSLSKSAATGSAFLTRVGHFELTKKIGEGGFGTVWKAKDTTLDRDVAIKIPHRGVLADVELEKFLREARAAAQLKHKNIVAVHEIGRDGEAVYIVSDLVCGETLAERIDDRSVNAIESVELCAKVCDALHHAHQNGIIHRDLKPQNVMVSPTNEPYLMDFGLAKRDAGEATLTIDGQILGTPAFMSPEQASGEGHYADRRTDIYSLGATLYQLLTGETPFRGNFNVLIHQVLYEEPTRPRNLNSTIHRDLETICLKCLEKDPARRYQTANELGDELRRFQRNEPILAKPASAFSKVWRWCGRNRLAATALFAVAGSLLIGFIVSASFAAKASTNLAEKEVALGEAMLVGANSLIRGRKQGYRSQAFQLLRQANRESLIDPEVIHTVAMKAMGDPAGLAPIDLKDFDENVTAFAIDPTEKLIAVAFGNGKIRLFDLDDSTTVAEFGINDSEIEALSFESDALGLIALGADGDLARYKLNQTTWSVDSRIDLGSDVVHATITPDASHCVVHREIAGEGQTKNEITVWNIVDGERFATYSGPADKTPRAAALSPDKSHLAVGYRTKSSSEDGILLWNIESQTVVAENTIPLGSVYGSALSFNSAGKILGYGCDQAVVILSVPDLEVISTRRGEGIKSLGFSPDDSLLATVDSRGVVKLRNAVTWEDEVEFSHPREKPSVSETILISKSGKYVASRKSGSVRLWNLGGACHERQVIPAHLRAIPAITFSPDGTLIATGSKDATVSFWNARTLEREGASLTDFEGGLQSVSFSPNGKRLATAYWGQDPKIQLWDVETRQSLGSVEHGLGDACRIAFLGDRKLVAAGKKTTPDAGVAIWQLVENDGVVSFEPRWNKLAMRCVGAAVDSEGHRVAWSEFQSPITTIHVLSTDNRLEASTKSRELAAQMLQGWHGLAFHAGTDSLLFVNQFGQLQGWNVEEDACIFTIGKRYQFQAPHIAISHSGTFVAAMADANTVAVARLDRSSHRRLFTFRSERTSVWSLAWSPDDSRLALGLSDGGMVVWNLSNIDRELTSQGLQTGEHKN